MSESQSTNFVTVGNQTFHWCEHLNLFWIGHPVYRLTATGVTLREAAENMIERINQMKNKTVSRLAPADERRLDKFVKLIKT